MLFDIGVKVECRQQPHSDAITQFKNQQQVKTVSKRIIKKIDDATYNSVEDCIFLSEEDKSMDIATCLYECFQKMLKSYSAHEQKFVKKGYLRAISIRRKADISRKLSNKLFEVYKEIKNTSLSIPVCSNI